MYHIAIILVAAFTTSGGGVLEKDRVVAVPDTQYADLATCRDSMRNDASTRGKIGQAIGKLQPFVADSSNPGQLIREAAKVKCVEANTTAADVLREEGLR